MRGDIDNILSIGEIQAPCGRDRSELFGPLLMAEDLLAAHPPALP
jgi:hypothetical protein